MLSSERFGRIREDQFDDMVVFVWGWTDVVELDVDRFKVFVQEV